MTRPVPGDPAPDFEVVADDGTTVSLADVRGRRCVLYFYPRDDTPGCTTQACGLRDEFESLRGLGVEVLGISPDTPASHVRFRERYALPFRLLSDAGHRVAERYGVWVEKEARGRRYWGVERTTFVIGPYGRIEHVFGRVKPAEHAAQLLDALVA
jgi:peroxiredoxin Q/BCP